MDFEQAIEIVLKSEGGYVNDPVDPGGETKYGISKRAYPHLDIAGLSKDQAKAIYRRDYWDAARVGELPPALRYPFFDMCVNMGIGRAVRLLQEACADEGTPGITVDGKMGPATVKAASRLPLDCLLAYRTLGYARVTFRSQKMMKYWYGWYRRAQKTGG